MPAASSSAASSVEGTAPPHALAKKLARRLLGLVGRGRSMQDLGRLESQDLLGAADVGARQPAQLAHRSIARKVEERQETLCVGVLGV